MKMIVYMLNRYSELESKTLKIVQSMKNYWTQITVNQRLKSTNYSDWEKGNSLEQRETDMNEGDQLIGMANG